MAERNENLLTSLPRDFKQMMQKVVQQVLIDKGVKANSELVKSVEFSDNTRTDSIYLWVAEHYEYVSTGRKPRAKKVPLYALINWIKSTGVTLKPGQSINQLAFVIQRSIYLNGIRGKNFIELVKDTVTDTVEVTIADMLEELVADALYTSFQIK